MNYRINDVADFLNVSKDLIRYYEKKGAIQPERDRDNNYRIYSIENIFRLMEILAFKDIGVNVRDISDTMKDPEMGVEYLKSHLQELRAQIQRETLLVNRMEELLERETRLSQPTPEGFVRRIPKRYLAKFVRYKNGEFGELLMPKKISRILFDSTRLPFLDAFCTFDGDTVNSYMALNERYLPVLSPYEPELFTSVEEGDYYCTVIEVTTGNFSDIDLPAIRRSAEKQEMVLSDRITGTFVYKTTNWQETAFRWNELELQIPILNRPEKSI